MSRRNVLRARSLCVLHWLAVSTILTAAPLGYGKGVRVPRPQQVVDKPSDRSAQLVAQGVMALVSRDFAQAYSYLSEAYGIEHRPDTLYQLGIVAYTEGQTVLSQDLLRRYLASTAEGTHSPQQRAEAERIVSQGQGQSGELLIYGEPETQILVDGRLVGVLPLPLPLLLATGSHSLVLQRGERKHSVAVEIESHRAYQITLDSAANPAAAPVLNRLPTALLQLDQDLYVRSVSAQQDTHSALLERIERAGLFVLSAPAHGQQDCKGDARCILKLADQVSADYLLTLSGLLTDPAPSGTVHVALIDATIGEAAAQQSVPCSPCTEAALTETLSRELPPLVRSAVTRGRGTLQIQTEPAGALVRLRNRKLGITPLTAFVFAGEVELTLVRPGFLPQTMRKEVVSGQTTQLVAKLAEEQTAPIIVRLAPERRPRPTWRVAAGIAGIGVGLGLVGLGASALAISGQCVEPATPPMAVCSSVYQTTPAGAALVGTGAALGIAGSLLWAWPGPRNLNRPAVPSRQSDAASPWALIP